MENKTTLLINGFLIFIMIIVAPGCKKSNESSQSPGPVPVVTTNLVSDIKYNSAVCGGIITNDGGKVVTKRGVCWSTRQNPTIHDSLSDDGTGAGNFVSNLSGLTLHTNYYVRAYATNGNGTGYGSIMTFTTSSEFPPILTTDQVTGVTPFAATTGGNIVNNGDTDIIARGVCWSTSDNPTIDDSVKNLEVEPGTFTCTISKLKPNTTYYLRAFATNATGTGYGNTVTFTTLDNTITDIDGNVYHYVTIGTQDWLVENLRTKSFQNGDPIPNVINDITWYYLHTPAYCSFLNLAQFEYAYGLLYNWYAVNDNRKIAPSGWHVSTKDDWGILLNYLGTYASEMIKEAGTEHWEAPNAYATNEVGFTALPGGYRDSGFNSINAVAAWWTNEDEGYGSASMIWLSTYGFGPIPYLDKLDGLSVRCVRDQKK